MSQIFRLHYRGHLKEDYAEEALKQAIENCVEQVRRLEREGRVLTAALYRSGRMLFLYYEALGEPLSVTEPIQAEASEAKETETKSLKGQEDTTEAQLLESGEDMQTTAVRPEEFLGALAPLLMKWPGQKEDRLWAHMYHIYCHSVPKSREQWKRAAVPALRRGRIAFLREDKLFSYIVYHRAIVEEGLLKGDKYQSIALHENILFSYFEEPKTFTNIQELEEESSVIDKWMAADPESHFIHMPEGGGENFMFLPALFALGTEDLGGNK